MKSENKTLTNIADWFYIILNAICCILMLLIVGSTFLQVFCRKVLNAPLSWSEEFSRLMFVWMNCLACAIAVKEGKHIFFAILTDKIFGEKGQKILAICIDTLLVAFFVFAMPSTFKLVAKTNSVPSAALQWPSGVFYLSFAIGGLAMILAYAIEILKITGVIKKGVDNVN